MSLLIQSNGPTVFQRNYTNENHKEIDKLFENYKGNAKKLSSKIFDYTQSKDDNLRDLVYVKAWTLSLTDKNVRSALEKAVQRSVRADVLYGRNNSFKDCNDIQLATLLRREKDQPTNPVILKAMNKLDRERLERLNSEFELKLDLTSVKLNDDDLSIGENEKRSILSRRAKNLLEGAGNLQDNVDFYAWVLETSKDKNSEYYKNSNTVLFKFHKEIGEYNENFNQLFEIILKHEELVEKNEKSNEKEINTETKSDKTPVKQNNIDAPVKTGKINYVPDSWETQGIVDILNNTLSHEAIDLYNKLIFIRSNPEDPRYSWANDMFESLSGSSPDTMTSLSTLDRSGFSSNETWLQDLELDDYVWKVETGQIKLDSSLELCEKLINIEFDRNHPKSDWAKEFLGEHSKETNTFLAVERLYNKKQQEEHQKTLEFLDKIKHQNNHIR